MDAENKSRGFWILTFSFAGLKLLVHLFTYNNYELHRDEMLYLAMGEHLSWGYMSTPPLLGFLAYLIKGFSAHSELAVKFFPIFSGAGSIVIIALFVRQLGGKNIAVFIACSAFLLSPAFLHSDNLLMPVPFDEFFWLWCAYLILRLVNSGNPKIWLWFGVLAAMAFMNKYSILFFAVALAVALFFSPHRKLLFSKYLLYAVLLAAIIVSPNIWWQFNHHFPLLTHMTKLQNTQLINENPAVFLTGQLLMNLPCFFIWITGLAVLLFVRQERKFQFIALSFVLVLVILMAGCGKAYYALGAYPMLFAAGGYAIEKYFTVKLAVIGAAFMLFALASSLLILPLSLPVLKIDKMEGYCRKVAPYIGTWPTRWEDGVIHAIPQTYADMTGWKHLAWLTAKAYNKLDRNDRNKCVIIAENYGLAGTIQYYGGYIYNLPQPVCLNDAYLFWAPDSIGDVPVIYVTHHSDNIAQMFNEYTGVGTVEDPNFREKGVKVFLCNHATLYGRNFYSEKVKRLKSEYGIED